MTSTNSNVSLYQNEPLASDVLIVPVCLKFQEMILEVNLLYIGKLTKYVYLAESIVKNIKFQNEEKITERFCEFWMSSYDVKLVDGYIHVRDMDYPEDISEKDFENGLYIGVYGEWLEWNPNYKLRYVVEKYSEFFSEEELKAFADAFFISDGLRGIFQLCLACQELGIEPAIRTNTVVNKVDRSVKKPAKKGFIYLIESNNYLKLGFSQNPDERLKALQTSHPEKLKLVLVIPGTLRKEQQIHRKMREYAVSGEWYLKQSFDVLIKLMKA